ncbi:hypothetical protein [Streptomyces sp. SID12501]|uniref:Uncharacterized protein n=1 Tax=Streptomyces sp. SID12501 TaxID=2706042 RepID=A0A6B3BUT8_9ACTN|nr:hypothetical protein [Streptomyces sp. SID12501]NEC88006.1 hypothetical protein [Streptomyces sp. SID12501]
MASSGPGGANHWSQQKKKAQLTRVWWRRMARAERTWKSGVEACSRSAAATVPFVSRTWQPVGPGLLSPPTKEP